MNRLVIRCETCNVFLVNDQADADGPAFLADHQDARQHVVSIWRAPRASRSVPCAHPVTHRSRDGRRCADCGAWVPGSFPQGASA